MILPLRIYSSLSLNRLPWLLCRVHCLLLFCFVGSGAGAQQNLFNIPSGDITPDQQFFYQHQVNIYANKFESKGHLAYGLGDGWEVGANLVGKGLYFDPNWKPLYNSNPRAAALYPVLLVTGQKQWRISKSVLLNAGLQGGVNISTRIRRKQLNYFVYSTSTLLFGKGSRVTGGVYHGNRMLLGQGNQVGVMAGYELKLNKRWYLMGDWVSGDNDASVAVLGAMYNAGKRVQLCAGWMIPNPETPKQPGLVVEVNLLGWDAF